MYNEKRRFEVSIKLQQIAEALAKEGIETNDFVLHQVGVIMGVVGTVFLSEQDFFIFTEMCSMFSAKKILDSMKDAENDTAVNESLERLKKKRTRKKGGEESSGETPNKE